MAASPPRLTSQMICNSTLVQIAEGEGILRLSDNDKARVAALAIEAAHIFYDEGFAGVHAWAFVLFGKYMDIKEEREKDS